jgi:hypothetical protein
MNCRVELIKFYKVQSILEASSSINKCQIIGNALTKIMFLLCDLTKMKCVGIQMKLHLILSVYLIHVSITVPITEKGRLLQKCLAPTR